MKVLTLNCGSSSVKYGVWEMPGAQPLCLGLVERVAIGGSTITHNAAGVEKLFLEHNCPSHDVAIALIFDTITSADHGVIKSTDEIGVVAHRVVHGGEDYMGSVKITDDVIRAIEENAVLAPLHNPNNLIGIRVATEMMPDILHTASWDTCFSAAAMPPKASIYAIPYKFYEEYCIRRYGYHGL